MEYLNNWLMSHTGFCKNLNYCEATPTVPLKVVCWDLLPDCDDPYSYHFTYLRLQLKPKILVPNKFFIFCKLPIKLFHRSVDTVTLMQQVILDVYFVGSGWAFSYDVHLESLTGDSGSACGTRSASVDRFLHQMQFICVIIVVIIELCQTW